MLKFAHGASMAAASALFLAGCSDVDGVGDSARVHILLTDAPSALFESATVTIGQVSIVPVDGAPVVLTSDEAEFDLLELQNGVTVTLASLDIEPGRYKQLRLVVADAEVTLSEGYEFNDGSTSMPLKVPSGAQSGIKINLRPAMEADDEEMEGIEITGETTLVVDFDVSQNFKIQGNPNTPAGLKGVLFTPSLRAVVFDGAGTISGTVTDAAGAAVAGATVKAMPPSMNGMESDETAVATAVTAEDGTYTIRFLLPGTYEVSVDIEGGTSETKTVEVGRDEDVTEVDFVVTFS